MRTAMLTATAVALLLSVRAPAPRRPRARRASRRPSPAARRTPTRPRTRRPHWLPPDMWVHLHWIPFDEARLHAAPEDRPRRDLVVAAARRPDARRARRRSAAGRTRAKLAAALVAPRAAHVSSGDAARAARPRATGSSCRVISPSTCCCTCSTRRSDPHHARDLFGVHSTTAFQAPAPPGPQPAADRAHPRPHPRADAARARARAARRRPRGRRCTRDVGAPGADRAPAPAAPDPALARRGPLQRPAADRRRQAAAIPFRPSFASPVAERRRHTVLFDAQQAAPPLAVRYGEVVLDGRDLRQRRPDRPARRARRRRCWTARARATTRACRATGASSPSRSAAGNRTFAKRYGNVTIGLADLRLADGPRADRRRAAAAACRPPTTRSLSA